MTIEAAAVASNPTDTETGLYLLGGQQVGFSAMSWGAARKSSEEVSSLRIAQVIGASGAIHRVEDDVAIIEGIAVGDYVAYDSYVVWHIPFADWTGQGLTVDGSIPLVDLESLID